MPTPRTNIPAGHRLGYDLFGSNPLDVLLADDHPSLADEAAEMFAHRLRRMRPKWMGDASCRRPEHATIDFFAAKTDAALRVCAQCPVMLACRDEAAAVSATGPVSTRLDGSDRWSDGRSCLIAPMASAMPP